MTHEKQAEARRRALRRRLADGAATVEIDVTELRWLLDEVSRLQQGNDRLRRQNRKVRLRLAAAGLPDDEAGADAEGGDDASTEPGVAR